jgi:hypothetical protein
VVSGWGSASVEPQVTLHHEPFVNKPSGFRLTKFTRNGAGRSRGRKLKATLAAKATLTVYSTTVGWRLFARRGVR